MFYQVTDKNDWLTHFKSLIVPRPIGWISSKNNEGQINLAPYSFFNAIATIPPMVVIGPGGYSKSGNNKDTLLNIKNNPEFVCNFVSWDVKDIMNESSYSFDNNESEIEKLNIETEDSTMVSIPRVKLSPAHFECTLFKIIDLPSDSKGNPNHLIIGNIIGINVSDKIIKNNRIDIGELKPISRMGYDEYALINTIFSMKRPK
ncbi:MAG: flavin reductase [Chloroflexi bacterium]|jgi:flavin reductase (DIM6/NTAB) family NADH-FMN oxidoreductase RutF|nr:flavin reductase [Chloroflexota bacterium]|tara:strand:+ start:8806 stop:9414 length:609 start_codon:yes stop_codon:yes gene_type:complete